MKNRKTLFEREEDLEIPQQKRIIKKMRTESEYKVKKRKQKKRLCVRKSIIQSLLFIVNNASL